MGAYLMCIIKLFWSKNAWLCQLGGISLYSLYSILLEFTMFVDER
jgi:hypothetical protein